MGLRAFSLFLSQKYNFFPILFDLLLYTGTNRVKKTDLNKLYCKLHMFCYTPLLQTEHIFSVGVFFSSKAYFSSIFLLFYLKFFFYIFPFTFSFGQLSFSIVYQCEYIYVYHTVVYSFINSLIRLVSLVFFFVLFSHVTI